MDGLRVRELLDLAALRGARLVAGAAGLERVVRSVNVMEVPDIEPWVRADELLLTTAYPLRDDPAGLADLVPRLARAGLAAIAVKPARYIDRIPATMIDAADGLSFPVIELPGDTSFNEVINAVYVQLLNRQAARLERAAAIHDRFTQIVLSGGGLRQICGALAAFIDRPVVVIGATGSILAGSPGALDGAGGLVRQVIRAGAEQYGWIVVGGRAERHLTEDDREAIEYAATVAALRQVQARAIAEADQRFQAVCLEELVTGHIEDRAVLMDRAAAFAWDLSVPRTVLLAQVDQPGDGAAPRGGGFGDDVATRRRLAEAVRAALGPTAIAWERSSEVAALVAAPAAASGDGPVEQRTRTALRALATDVHLEIGRRLPGLTASVGAGRPRIDPLELDRSFAEARRAIEIARWRSGAGTAAVFDDLGLDGLLATCAPGDLRALVESEIGPLLAYDRRHRTSLADTLAAYLGSRNAASAARQLFVHYNTLTYRLDRIAELIGPFLDDPDRCLTLTLALRLRHLPGVDAPG